MALSTVNCDEESPGDGSEYDIGVSKGGVTDFSCIGWRVGKKSKGNPNML
jgi:hypothetical protein